METNLIEEDMYGALSLGWQSWSKTVLPALPIIPSSFVDEVAKAVNC